MKGLHHVKTWKRIENPSVRLTIARPRIKELFKDLLAEIKGFKYQITLKVLLSKYKENAEREFAPVYFNSTTKTVMVLKTVLSDLLKNFFIRMIIGLMKGLVG